MKSREESLLRRDIRRVVDGLDLGRCLGWYIVALAEKASRRRHDSNSYKANVGVIVQSL